jgi:hypothetical protein
MPGSDIEFSKAGKRGRFSIYLSPNQEQMKGLRSLLLLLFLLFPIEWMLAQQETEIDWVYEIELLGTELAQKHPDLFYKVDSSTFFRDLKQIARSTKGQSTFEISVRLQQVLARMGDAHTLINYHFNVDPDFILPIDCYWFQEGIYILKSPIEYKQILGKRVVSINGNPFEELVDSLSTLIVDDNASLLKYHVPRMIKWTQLLEHFGFADHEGMELVVADQAGLTEKVYISLPQADGEMVTVKPDSIPFGFRDRKAFFQDHYFTADRIYYIQYNRCWSREIEEEYGTGASALFMPSFKEFEMEVFQNIKKNPIDRLVFDMRFNSGGNSAQGTGFIKKLCKSMMKKEGEIYVMIGRKTFSSAIINTVDFMNLAEVVTVGEESGGRPNHFGEIQRFVLPESKLVINHSTKYFVLLEKDVPSILPQLMVPISFEDYMHGIDSALEAVRMHRTE